MPRAVRYLGKQEPSAWWVDTVSQRQFCQCLVGLSIPVRDSPEIPLLYLHLRQTTPKSHLYKDVHFNVCSEQLQEATWAYNTVQGVGTQYRHVAGCGYWPQNILGLKVAGYISTCWCRWCQCKAASRSFKQQSSPQVADALNWWLKVGVEQNNEGKLKCH